MKLSTLRKILATGKRNGRTTIECHDGKLSIQTGTSYNPTTMSIDFNTGDMPCYFDGADLQSALKGHTGALLRCYDGRLLTDTGAVALAPLDDIDRWQPTEVISARDGIELKHANIKRAMMCAANNDVRYYLKGFAVYANGGIAATDGHRLYYDYTPRVDEVPNGIIPRHAGEILTAIGSDAWLSSNGLNAVITGDSFTISFAFIDAKYPSLDKVINDADAMATVNRKALLKECKRLLPAANKVYKGCKVTVNGSVHLDVSNDFTGSVDCESIADCNFGINLTYLIDALSASNDDTVTIATNPDNDGNVKSAIQFKSVDHTSLVMPMRM